MAVPALSRRDLDFLLYEWLDVERLTERPRFAEHSRETFDAVLDLSADVATKHFAPHNKKSDANEPVMAEDGTVTLVPEIAEGLAAFTESGLFAASFDEEIGGLQLPMSVMRACMAWFQAANASTSNYAFLTIGNAHCIVAHGSESQVDEWVQPMLEGRYFGTMALSEPQAGSSLADITTMAVPQDDGTFRLTGTKMWISGGDHELSENIVHLVLAKTPGAPAGVKGISLFIVPKYLHASDGSLGERNDVVLAGLNHKMGQRGTTNTLLNFGEGKYTPGGSAGAVGYLLGELHSGLAYMFHMMNEARIGVGMLATSLGYVGYRQALDYAKVRTQGRALGVKDPATPPVALIEHADVRRMLLEQKAYVEGGMALGLYCSTLVDEEQTAESEEERTQATLLLDILTPIAKSWPSQWALRANELAIQVHGGYGYTRDFDVEQFYRDNRLNPIHEGTHGVQGLDLLGRKVTMKGGAALGLLLGRIEATAARAIEAGGEAAEQGRMLQAAAARIQQSTELLWGQGDPAVALANSSVYLEAVGHVVVAWLWLDQALAAGDKTGEFYEGKRRAASFFFAWELPKTGPQFDLLDSLNRDTLDMEPAWF
ncbi:acyl-CoA dehydrogenase [Salinibacterium sp. dk2585]|uniref:acyl-CoA dehydrogenase n=1 Tax=unclassified Salinibacterium TaxID=2632331 RepID=UPI0011C24787|nr:MULTISPECIES: acyl-CoA dehydrogenase [unclassified Salinibacterium]QEE60314.1 acyl-CoA dehydrogenase [Salinibacterium sp. dk2585]TXK55386.1 acyl-CoA dehydrogenase [Salinibacterium sp. dk5596]